MSSLSLAETAARARLIVALDVAGETAALRLVEQLAGAVGVFKIGLELFTLVGPSIVERVRAASGGESGIFLDLKFHDIPNTVERAVRSATGLGVEMLTVHASGGSEMLRAAVRGTGEMEEKKRPLVLGVTVLTSSSAETLRETGLDAPEEAAVAVQVLRLARLAAAAGLGGLVASPLEIGALRAALGKSLRLVIPGVRPSWAAAAGDQRRVLTPGEAIAAGADYLVVGRPITGANDPGEAARRIVEEIAASA